MRRAPAVLTLAAVLATAGVAGAEGVDLALSEEFKLNETTLALGHVDPGQADLSDVHAVGIHTLDLPDGTLWVCRMEGGQRDEVPPIPTLQERCRGEEEYENPRIEVGDRTWAVFAGNLTMTEPPTAALAALSPSNGTLRLAAATAGSMDGTVDGDLAFRPQLPASQVRVQDRGDDRTYNGTSWVFFLEASGPARLGADGLHARLPLPANLTVTPAGTQAMEQALEPRKLLDLQAAALGPDNREPVANVTALVGDRTRLPPVVDGALLGHLNGTVGDHRLDPDTVSLVGLDRLDGEIRSTNLTGEAELRFTDTAAGFGVGGEDPSGVPWIAATLAWVAAGVSIAIGPAAPARSLHTRAIAAGGFLVALALWDRIVLGALGASVSASGLGEASLAAGTALGSFEAIAFGLAWLGLALPVRLVLDRWLDEDLSPAASPVVTLGLLVFAWIDPGAIVAVGRLVAQL